MRRLILPLCLAFAAIAPAQEVTRVNRPYLLLDLPETSGVSAGAVLPLERHLPSGARVTVGSVKLLFYRDTISVALILDEDQFLSIQEGDRLQLHPLRTSGSGSVRGSFAAAAASPWVSYTAAGLGLVSGGLAWFYYEKAAEAASTTPESLSHYLRLSRKVTAYDNRSNLFQGVGAGFFVFSALHYFFIRDSRPVTHETATAVITGQREGTVFAGLQVAIPAGG
ncbi:hypothetical protein JXO52_11095 [bacterium]|nr:hypothetical protein [bacterium]